MKLRQMAAAAVTLLLTTAGCSSAVVSSTSVAGTWHGTANDTFILRDDGTFVYTNFPLQRVDPDSFSAPQTGTGRWDLVGPGSNQVQHINVNFTENYFGEIYVDGTGRGMRLFEWVGKGFDQQYWFTRVPLAAS